MKPSEESSEEEWEDVEDNHHASFTEQNIQVEVDVPDIVKKKQKKQATEKEMMEICIRRAANKANKTVQLNVHKVHLTSLLTVGMRLNQLCNSFELQARGLSILPMEIIDTKPKSLTIGYLSRLVQVISNQLLNKQNPLDLKTRECISFPLMPRIISSCISKCSFKFKLDFILAVLVIMRALGIKTRLVTSLHPLTFKVMTEKQKQKISKTTSGVNTTTNKKKNKPKNKKQETIPQVDGASDSPQKRITRSRAKKAAGKTKCEQEVDDGETLHKIRNSKIIKGNTIIKKEINNSRTSKNKTATSKATSVHIDENVKSSKTVPNNNFVKEIKKQKKCLTQHNKNTLNAKNNKIKRQSTITNKENNNSDNEFEDLPIKRRKSAKLNKENKKKNTSKKPVSELEDADKTPLNKALGPSKAKRNLRTRKSLKMTNPDSSNDDEKDEDFKVVSSESESDDENIDKNLSDDDFEVISPSRKKSHTAPSFHVNDAVNNKTTKKGNIPEKEISNEWMEVYIEKDLKWVTVDCFHNSVNHPELIEQYTTSPMHYVTAFDEYGSIKDVTARYAKNWLTSTRKLRVGSQDKDWWKETLLPYKTKNLRMDEEENRQMHSYLMSLPLPNTISAFKDHPLFALRRHILKYEEIYPPDIATVGYIRGEEIFPRSAVHILHTKDKWLQHARTVIPGEEPYKMVASMWRNMKLKQDYSIPCLPLFGRWQTVPYDPPIAKDGKVPRNEFGNVDLFQPEMLPIGCAHVRINTLKNVARKLNIDIAPAVVGFDSHSGYPHPVNDGFVVCEEFKDTLIVAWKEDQAIQEEKRIIKRQERIYGNWKTLIRGLQVRDKIKKKYKLNEKLSPVKKSKVKGKGKSKVEVVTESSYAWQANKLEDVKKEESSKKRRRGRKRKSEELFPFEEM